MTTDANKAVTVLEQQLDVKTRLLKNSELALKVQSSQIQELEDQVLELRESNARLSTDLQVAYNDIENYLTSTSWKLTKPIRVLRNMVKRVFKS